MGRVAALRPPASEHHRILHTGLRNCGRSNDRRVLWRRARNARAAARQGRCRGCDVQRCSRCKRCCSWRRQRPARRRIATKRDRSSVRLQLRSDGLLLQQQDVLRTGQQRHELHCHRGLPFRYYRRKRHSDGCADGCAEHCTNGRADGAAVKRANGAAHGTAHGVTECDAHFRAVRAGVQVLRSSGSASK